MPLTTFNNSEEFRSFTDWDFEDDRYQGCPSDSTVAMQMYRHDQFFPSTRTIANATSYNNLGYHQELWDPELKEQLGTFKFNFKLD